MDKLRNSRIFSIIKAIAIICMVAGHTSFMPVRGFVYLFHMAVFYMVAGYFFKDDYCNDKMIYIWKKVKSLWLPLIGYGLVFLILHNLFYKIHIYSPVSDHLYTLSDYTAGLKAFLQFNVKAGNLLGAFWFLRSIFVSSIIFMVGVWIARLTARKYSEIVLGGGILAAVIGCLVFHSELSVIGSTTIRDIFCREIYIVGLMYFGRLFRIYQKYIPVNSGILIMSFVLLMIAQLCGVSVEIAASQFPQPIVIFYVVSLIGFLFVYELAAYLERWRLASQPLQEIGNATLSIMALHFLAFKLVSVIEIWVYNLDIEHLSDFPVIREHIGLWWLPYTIVGIWLPMLYVCFKRAFLSRFSIDNFKSNVIYGYFKD